jgi:succinate dehydrogenase / fumarate reductase cytochrome b subunit
MSWVLSFWKSDLGKKAVMAVSGLVLFGFVLVHMLGNLKVYQGPEVFNHYAEGLREVGAPFFPHNGLLWIARVVLLGCVLLHALAAYQLTTKSWRARPIPYTGQQTVQADYASFMMRWGGVVLALFILYHLAHLTLGWVHPNFDPKNVYQNFVVGFRSLPVCGLYIVAQLALGLHLYHGLWSLFQSLGWSHAEFNPWRRTFAQVFAALITAGNISFPLAVLTGIIS